MELLTITEHEGEGLGGFVYGEDYRIIILNYLDRLHPARLDNMQKHLETDESFILLAGKAVLFTAAGDAAPEKMNHCIMEQGKIYTVPRGVWHTQSMGKDARILLVERKDTTEENSPRLPLPLSHRQYIRQACCGITDI